MQLITDEYRRLNYEKHVSSTGYGTSGQNYANEILGLCDTLKTRDILDYGCGKSTLQNCLPFTIKQYDPAIKKYEHDPESADLVVCTDVLEHIEPDLLDNVLRHMHSKTNKLLYAAINTQKALKTLADGRNAHLIVEDIPYWANKLDPYFKVLSILRQGPDFIYIAEAKKIEKELP